MGIWIEFRCENRTNESSRGLGLLNQQCESRENAGPMDMAKDTQESVLKTLQLLSKEAAELGWKKTKYGWICAFCAAQPNTMAELKAEASS